MRKLAPFLISAFWCYLVHSQSIPQSRIEALDAFLNQQVERDSLVGAYVLIAQGDDIVISKGYGTTDINGGQRPSEHTFYRMASMSKAVTAIAVLKACEEYQISIDTPVSIHLDIVPDKSVTVRQMLSQTSGWGIDCECAK